MNVTRPARCLLCSFSRAATPVTRVPRRQFHPTPVSLSNRKPKFPNVKATSGENYQPYTEEQKAELAKQYSEAQMAAINAGESAIDPKDLAEQLKERSDPMSIKYLDDFSVIEPSIDRHQRAPVENTDYNFKFKNDDDFAEDFGRWMESYPEGKDPTGADFVQWADSLRVTKGKAENELNPNSSLVPDFFGPGETIDEPSASEQKTAAEKGEKERSAEAEEMTDGLKSLLLATGYTERQVSNLQTKTLVSRSVVNQTRLGKVRRAYRLSIAGNGNGLLGIGEAKSDEAADAKIQSQYRAIRNMQPIPRYENRTIFGDVKGKVGATSLQLMHRPPGFGLRVQHLIYEMCRAGGIHDLSARTGRSRNPMNTVKAAYEAIMSQRNPDQIAHALGRKLVDVRKVYYAGKV
ncbi:Ribosomal protein S5 C-terminal [Penicillium brevicompactum]|uniref:Small ribosomal subunit protein uS5m n=1 Tax=Penicillium brevicompactum TaxID=5074 RepID=A0A9W9UXM0_PENBR|nr:Ribosomal protein S5 C-terminal [Penicillium brevicompactum]KAJ5361167.1 Ribosomal protein S5 C-terminal [Penicillium brevicompactum]